MYHTISHIITVFGNQKQYLGLYDVREVLLHRGVSEVRLKKDLSITGTCLQRKTSTRSVDQNFIYLYKTQQSRTVKNNWSFTVPL